MPISISNKNPPRLLPRSLAALYISKKRFAKFRLFQLIKPIGSKHIMASYPCCPTFLPALLAMLTLLHGRASAAATARAGHASGTPVGALLRGAEVPRFQKAYFPRFTGARPASARRHPAGRRARGVLVRPAVRGHRHLCQRGAQRR